MAATFVCPECEKPFRNESGLSWHLERAHSVAPEPPPGVNADGEVPGPVAAALERSFEAATHLGPEHVAAQWAARLLARQLDANPELRPGDVVLPTFLRYLNDLGLTPLAASKLGLKEQKPKGRLGELRSIEGGRAS